MASLRCKFLGHRPSFAFYGTPIHYVAKDNGRYEVTCEICGDTYETEELPVDGSDATLIVMFIIALLGLGLGVGSYIVWLAG